MKKGLCVRPEKGDAVLFWSVVSHGEGGREGRREGGVRGGKVAGNGNWGGVGGRTEGVGFPPTGGPHQYDMGVVTKDLNRMDGCATG